jgi:hypothetical protein
VGCHSSQARASATSGGEVSPARTRGMEAWGNPGGPSRLNGGAWAAFLRRRWQIEGKLAAGFGA